MTAKGGAVDGSDRVLVRPETMVKSDVDWLPLRLHGRYCRRLNMQWRDRRIAPARFTSYLAMVCFLID